MFQLNLHTDKGPNIIQLSDSQETRSLAGGVSVPSATGFLAVAVTSVRQYGSCHISGGSRMNLVEHQLIWWTSFQMRNLYRTSMIPQMMKTPVPTATHYYKNFFEYVFNFFMIFFLEYIKLRPIRSCSNPYIKLLMLYVINRFTDTIMWC